MKNRPLLFVLSALLLIVPGFLPIFNFIRNKTWEFYINSPSSSDFLIINYLAGLFGWLTTFLSFALIVAVIIGLSINSFKLSVISSVGAVIVYTLISNILFLISDLNSSYSLGLLRELRIIFIGDSNFMNYAVGIIANGLLVLTTILIFVSRNKKEEPKLSPSENFNI